MRVYNVEDLETVSSLNPIELGRPVAISSCDPPMPVPLWGALCTRSANSRLSTRRAFGSMGAKTPVAKNARRCVHQIALRLSRAIRHPFGWVLSVAQGAVWGAL